MVKGRCWLLLLAEIPANRPALRVRVWRRLREIGAPRLSTGAHLLPEGDDEREDFDWLVQEIRRGGGNAIIAGVSRLFGITEGEAVELFRRARTDDYVEWGRDLKAWRRETKDGSSREGREALGALRRRLMEIEKLDRFPGVSREEARRALGAAESSCERRNGDRAEERRRLAPGRFRGRVWATRPDPKSDRLACAWLVRRFIDPKARFRFEPDPRKVSGAVAFDAPGAVFTHRGEDCTFEVLVKAFGVSEPGVAFVAEIIHDIDVKDGKFGRLETPGFAKLLEGLRATEKGDARRVEKALPLFDWLAASGARNG